jgi:hypothetical protein
MQQTFNQYAQEVRSGKFPGEEHTYAISEDVLAEIEAEFGPAD